MQEGTGRRTRHNEGEEDALQADGAEDERLRGKVAESEDIGDDGEVVNAVVGEKSSLQSLGTRSKRTHGFEWMW